MRFIKSKCDLQIAKMRYVNRKFACPNFMTSKGMVFQTLLMRPSQIYSGDKRGRAYLFCLHYISAYPARTTISLNLCLPIIIIKYRPKATKFRHRSFGQISIKRSLKTAASQMMHGWMLTLMSHSHGSATCSSTSNFKSSGRHRVCRSTTPR